MIDFIKTKKIYFVALAVLFLFVSLSDTTYSLFLKSDTTNEFNYGTGLLDLEFISNEPINLKNAFPTIDSDALNNKAYTITVKNTGSLAYQFDLKMLSTETTDVIDYKYIKVKVNDYLSHTLDSTNNILDSNIIIYPGEEITYKIKIWLDIDTPNNELGKTFNAKIVATGKSVYKTLDDSGANHPKLNNNMISVYYDKSLNKWRIADKSNTNTSYVWYNYSEAKWANVITVASSDKKIYDLTGRNNIRVNNLRVNNNNLIIDEDYLDLNISNYKYNDISNIFRVKFDELKDNIYIISNDKMAYYYNQNNKTFIFKNGNNAVTSNQYDIEQGKWYIIGYTYDGNDVSFYINGDKLSTANIKGNVSHESSFKLGTNSANQISKMTIGDALFYNRILSDNEIANNYRTSMNIIYQNLLYGYSEFMPMTLNEHYLSSNPGTIVMDEDIGSQYVWIPRFKYRVWNVLGEENRDVYDAYHKGINIIFESLDTSSGTIYCTDNNCYSDIEKTIPVTANDNGKYYTHPAFSMTTKELTGFWVSKYEIANNNQSKKGLESLRNTYLSTYYRDIKKTNNDYSVIKNTEWGAINYLAHSKYGLCPDNLCIEMSHNSTFIAGADNQDTTTDNIYGVFDLNGGAAEYTMANITTNDTLDLDNSHFRDVPLGNDDYDLYQKDAFILGDATRETNGWYNLTINIDNQKNWLVRNNLFGYTSEFDIQSNDITSRIVIK